MKVIFDHSAAEADNIRTFYFKAEAAFEYTAGQYIELSLPHKNPDERGQKRWFTLSSSPLADFLTITTKFAGNKSSSFKKALFKLEPGKVLNINGPFGDFVLPKLIQTPLVFVAGGIGITPFHSILEWLAATKEVRPIRLLYGVRTEDEIIFQSTFDKSGVQPTVVVSDPSAAWGGERGILSAEIILGLEKPTEDTLVYVSGPEVMIQKLAQDLHKAGLEKRQIVSDEFPNYERI
ncbi:MAG TPA: FAD-dependent oxidoreductase [Candidatus Saccharimonadales bacterium]|jgi:ferredoxin-NADP reductase|nr:FAD-dependent oxidoreductase [Candidatus Saccharimonadales bacterium]